MAITLYSNNADTKIILSYTFDLLKEKNKDKEIDCEYINIERKHYRDYKKDNSDYMFLHVFNPTNGTYVIDDIEIEISDFILNGKIQILSFKDDHYPIKKVVFKSSSHENITKFIEDAINKKFNEKQDKFVEVSGDKIIKKKWTGYCWN